MIKNIYRFIGLRYLECENGVVALEYAMIGAIIIVVLVAGIQPIADFIEPVFQQIADAF